MVVYRNTSVIVQLEEHIHTIRHTWSGYPSSKEYKNTFQRSLKVAEKHHVNNWLIDQRALKKFQFEDLQWGIEQWVPQAVSILGTGAHIAIVLSPTNQFGKLGADISINAVRAIDASCQSRYFTNLYEARQWIANIGNYQSLRYG